MPTTRIITSTNNSKALLESMSQATWYNQWTLKKFESYVKGSILEVGCGLGSFTKTLGAYGNVWAIDIVNDYIKEAKKQTFYKVNIGFGNIEKGTYFFKKRKFDTIICLNVLEHIKDDVKALFHIKNLLKQHGYVILLVPAHQMLFGSIDKAIGHYRRYQKGALEKILNDYNFHVVLSKKINFFGALGWFFDGKILHNTLISDRKLKLFNKIAPFILPLEKKINIPIGTSILIVAQKY